jgi:hypothetical protein
MSTSLLLYYVEQTGLSIPTWPNLRVENSAKQLLSSLPKFDLALASSGKGEENGLLSGKIKSPQFNISSWVMKLGEP